MERIDTGSEVNSSSIREDLKTRTLYEMVTAWAEQPWDGVRYKRIVGELWDSIDDLNLMEGPYGVSVTLLESCIVDSTEALRAGQLTEEQAVDGLKKLLENELKFTSIQTPCAEYQMLTVCYSRVNTESLLDGLVE
jgi:hypothetical protein